jgi:tetratricopeptide (TPR) repeat protein
LSLAFLCLAAQGAADVLIDGPGGPRRYATNEDYAETLVPAAMEHFGRKEYRQALADFEGILMWNRYHPKALRYSADCLYYQGKRREALIYYERYLDLKGTAGDLATRAFAESLRKKVGPLPARFSDEERGGGSAVHWMPARDLDAAIRKDRSKPVLLFFTSPDLSGCVHMRREFFEDPEVAAWINERFIAVVLVNRQWDDGKTSHEATELQRRFKIKDYPTVIVNLAGTRKTATHVDFATGDRDAAFQWLKEGI